MTQAQSAMNFKPKWRSVVVVVVDLLFCVLLSLQKTHSLFTPKKGETPKRSLLLLLRVFQWKSRISENIESFVAERSWKSSMFRRFFASVTRNPKKTSKILRMKPKILEIFENVADLARTPSSEQTPKKRKKKTSKTSHCKK